MFYAKMASYDGFFGVCSIRFARHLMSRHCATPVTAARVLVAASPHPGPKFSADVRNVPPESVCSQLAGLSGRCGPIRSQVVRVQAVEQILAQDEVVLAAEDW
jgi:hypothetical protein